ncbi:hypothetical protein BDF19DRAFT_428389 [Syncephalis fuscata]|nr:hypothetical protein BDF19DRAFT_428389 [Syncephalis fuscata]
MSASVTSSTTSAPPSVHPNKAAFIEGVELSLKSWTALRLAIDNDWGNDDMGEEKQLWMCDILVDYFGQRAQHEFNTMLEDGSAFEMGKQLVTMYREVIRGNHRLVIQLREKAARRTQQSTSITAQSIQQPTGDGDDSSDGDDDDNANHDATDGQ